MGLIETIRNTDSVGQFVALLMLLMSIASWVVILWKARVLWRALRHVPQAIAAFWRATDFEAGTQAAAAFDPSKLVGDLIAATAGAQANTLAAASDRSHHLTRMLRDALHRIVAKLQ